MATQNPALMNGLVVEDKKHRVANFHKHTVESFVELIGAANLNHPDEIDRNHIYRRVSINLMKSYEEIYPTALNGSLLIDASHNEVKPLSEGAPTIRMEDIL